MGLVPAILEAEADDRIPSHWLSLAANGANFSDLRGPADLLLGGGLRPKLLILGIHRGMLVRSEDTSRTRSPSGTTISDGLEEH